MENNKQEFSVVITLADGSQYNGKTMYNAKNFADRYYKTLEEAQECKRVLLDRHNRKFNYDDDGNRIETTSAGGIGVDMVVTSKMDELNRIVKAQIFVRTVSPWQEVNN